MAKGSFGERLKREREMREISLDELTKSTRISQRFLEALENEDWTKLPGGVFGRGFVRTIAGYLGLDEESLLGEYDLARGDVTSGAKHDDPIPSAPIWVPAVAVLAVGLLLVGLFFAGRYAWRRYAAHRAEQHTSALVNAPPGSASSRSFALLLELHHRRRCPASVPLRLDTMVLSYSEARPQAGGNSQS